MQPVVAPSRSNHTRSVFARFLVRFSGNGIFTDVTRLMALRTSSRSAALMEVGATARSKHARRGLIGWNIWEISGRAAVRRGDQGSFSPWPEAESRLNSRQPLK